MQALCRLAGYQAESAGKMLLFTEQGFWKMNLRSIISLSTFNLNPFSVETYNVSSTNKQLEGRWYILARGGLDINFTGYPVLVLGRIHGLTVIRTKPEPDFDISSNTRYRKNQIPTRNGVYFNVLIVHANDYKVRNRKLRSIHGTYVIW